MVNAQNNNLILRAIQFVDDDVRETHDDAFRLLFLHALFAEIHQDVRRRIGCVQPRVSLRSGFVR